jgi:hypothetical protein
VNWLALLPKLVDEELECWAKEWVLISKGINNTRPKMGEILIYTIDNYQRINKPTTIIK